MVYTGKFEAPGPGSWERESTHLLHPMSRWLADLFPGALMRGFKAMAAHYGLLLDHVEMAVVEGFLYASPRVVGAPPSAKGPPPKPIFKLLTWLHPEIRRRVRRSREALANKIWRDELKEWDERLKPALAATQARLLASDVAALPDGALAAHLEQCRRALDDSVVLHHRLTGCSMVPMGDYLIAAAEWTGLPEADLIAPFRGASPVSAGATAEIDALVAAIRADAEAEALVREGGVDAAGVLRDLRARPGALGEAARAYLDLVGYRMVTGMDVADRYALEMPDVLVRTIRSALSGEHRREDGDAALAKVRDAVPAGRRAAFEELLAEALLLFRVRDERCLLNDARTTGIVRRALLEAGGRLAARSRLADPTHVVDLRHDELLAALRGAGCRGPSKEEVAAYVAYRTSKTIHDAPERLGPPPAPPPPPEWLPPEAARVTRSVGAVLGAMFETRALDGTELPSEVVRGLPVGGGRYEGTARLVLTPADFARIQKGDVLVARATAPSYNTLLPLIGALVTDRGGLLSHPAIVAREVGIPGVVGCVDATARIKDGARVRVDGTAGEVEVL